MLFGPLFVYVPHEENKIKLTEPSLLNDVATNAQKEPIRKGAFAIFIVILGSQACDLTSTRFHIFTVSVSGHCRILALPCAHQSVPAAGLSHIHMLLFIAGSLSL